jgi:hypothetical protein
MPGKNGQGSTGSDENEHIPNATLTLELRKCKVADFLG